RSRREATGPRRTPGRGTSRGRAAGARAWRRESARSTPTVRTMGAALAPLNRSWLQHRRQQRAGPDPIAPYGPQRESQLRGNLRFGKTGEEAQLDEPREPRRRLRQTRAGRVNGEQRLRLVVAGDQILLERDALQFAAMPLRGALASPVHQDVSHGH